MKRWLALLITALILGGIIWYNKFRKTGSDATAAPGAAVPANAPKDGGKPGEAKPGGDKTGPAAGGGGRSGGGPITVFVAAYQNLKEEVVSSGSLLPNEQVDIYPETSGRIVTLNIQEGRPVAAGTLLVKIYDGDLQAQLLKLRAQQENAQRTEDRNKQLLARGGISQQEYDLATTNLRGAAADIELTNANIRRTVIRAPFSGVIGLRNVSPGAVVTPNTLIARLQQISSLKLDFSIPERYGQQVKPGNVVSFLVDGAARPSQGVVYAIDPGVDEQTRNLRIRARVSNTLTGGVQPKFRPGTFAKVTLTIQNERSVVVPTQAVIPQTRTRQVVVVKNGKAQFRDVTTGIRTESVIQVISGLSVGDTVATSGLLFLKPDSPVKIGKVVKQ